MKFINVSEVTHLEFQACICDIDPFRCIVSHMLIFLKAGLSAHILALSMRIY